MTNQVIDQLAHFAVAAVIVWMLNGFLPFFVAFGIMLTAAYTREVIQRTDDGKTLKEALPLSPGGWLDMAVFFVGGWVGGFTI